MIQNPLALISAWMYTVPTEGGSMSQTCFLIKLFLFATLTILLVLSLAHAHRSGCHRWHSCPSDSGSYICGDLGYCSQCPDNAYCQGGQSRQSDADTSSTPSPIRDDVREAQRMLNALGYEAGAVDGIYGAQTRQAIEKFNRDDKAYNTLPVVNKRLLSRLRAYVELRELQRR